MRIKEINGDTVKLSDDDGKVIEMAISTFAFAGLQKGEKVVIVDGENGKIVKRKSASKDAVKFCAKKEQMAANAMKKQKEPLIIVAVSTIVIVMIWIVINGNVAKIRSERQVIKTVEAGYSEEVKNEGN